MEIEYDPAKSEKNIRERGLSFSEAERFNFDTATIEPVLRKNEERFMATGHLGERIHVLCYKLLDFGIRVISFRKANQREVRRYEEGRRNLEQGTGVD